VNLVERRVDVPALQDGVNPPRQHHVSGQSDPYHLPTLTAAPCDSAGGTREHGAAGPGSGEQESEQRHGVDEHSVK